MHQQGFFVPPFAVSQLFRTACHNDRGVEIFEAASNTLPLPQEAVVVLLDDCQKRNDLPLALRIEKSARDNGTALPVSAYDALLKICVVHANLHALELFQEMQKDAHRISEGLCVGLLARCAESKFLRFAEEIAGFVRGRDGMSIAVYSALMKVYAYCGMYDKACDLYAQIRAEGLEPDSMMYGCLMKFSVECGRTELSRELFEKAPSLDIQNYMSLIRAAGRDKDVNRAFAVLDKLKSSSVTVDIAAYNCVLDACVSAGDLKRARILMTEMSSLTTLDIITYNTLLKGYCSRGDVRGAKDVFMEMERAGLAPNDVSYNCLINAAVTSGNFKEAWNTIEMMERNGVAVDHFTISIMMKSIKKVKDPKDVARALDLLDRTRIDVCSDEVLLNTVLETCTRHRQMDRLVSVVAAFTASKLRPSVHTYGSLIKACSTMKQLDKCRELWRMMVEECAMLPNDIVLGCMLDALVCNGKVEEAVNLLISWKAKIPPNTVMYSTIIKGFANNRQAARALDMWKEMCELGLTFNTVVYNALIDSQARVGAMDSVSKLVESMAPSGCTPDSITYSTIVKGYCIKGDLDKAFEVFRSMQSSGMAVDSIIYNTVMDGCTRHNRMDLVDLVLEDMEKFSIKPSNFTLGILVKMYGRRHQLEKAFKVIEELPKRHGFHANSQARTCLMCACLSNNSADRAMKVFEDLKQTGEGADSKAYGSLLSGLVRLDKLTQACALVEEAYGIGQKRGLPAGQVLEAETLEQLMRALGQKQLMPSQGVPLLEKLRAARVPISGRLFSSSLRS
jgi:pentatricopeptide repeat protein